MYAKLIFCLGTTLFKEKRKKEDDRKAKTTAARIRHHDLRTIRHRPNNLNPQDCWRPTVAFIASKKKWTFAWNTAIKKEVERSAKRPGDHRAERWFASEPMGGKRRRADTCVYPIEGATWPSWKFPDKIIYAQTSFSMLPSPWSCRWDADSHGVLWRQDLAMIWRMWWGNTAICL